MLRTIVSYFASRHVLTNLLFLSVLLGGLFAWEKTQKEEMPSITFDMVRISVRYTGAPAEDVEYFVTKPIEEAVRGLDGVYRITSTSSVGSSNIVVELERNYSKIDEAILELRTATLDVQLPAEIIDDPVIRVFKTSKKAILDIALLHKDAEILTVSQRKELQRYALSLENQLLNLQEVHSVNRQGYLQEEIQVRVDPKKLVNLEIPFNTVIAEVRDNHVRAPAGTLEAAREPKVTLVSELDTPQKLANLVVQGGFNGKVIRLGEIADIGPGYEKNETVLKVNGHEAVMFNVVKNGSHGILKSLDAVTVLANRFNTETLKGTNISLRLLDDESVDVRNRLQLIGSNGAIGFALILVILFVFLDPRAGLWVAMGIPFTICFTLLFGSLFGLTINGTTLAAVIIVMGIVVDDAIIVAENITRLCHRGMERSRAVVEGTAYMLKPIFASIVTTCVAFIPLFFFQGRFGSIIEFIPPVIFLMLAASLFESMVILPGHMSLGLFTKIEPSKATPAEHWFDRVEQGYAKILASLLNYRFVIVVIFLALLTCASWVALTKMKFVMFPNEETRDLVLTGDTETGSTRYETARKLKEIEDLITPYLGKEVVAFRSEIARSRRGGAVAENNFRTIVEIVAREKRELSADQIVEKLTADFARLKGFKHLKFKKTRWGQDSGSPVEIIVQQNNNEIRAHVVELLQEKLQEHSALKNVEIDQAFTVPEYRITIDREMIKRLSITPADLVSTFRAALEGIIVYEFSDGDEDIYVRLTTIDSAKKDIESVLQIPVENKGGYLVPLKSIVSFAKVNSPNSISRRDTKRTTIIDADLSPGANTTPLEIANYLERKVFPEIISKYPSTNLSFGGEILDSRESKNDFEHAIIMVLVLIYVILAALFNSITKPLIIILAIPFGVVGIILAFYAHGKLLLGFYACVGALGLGGVVINDAIIMLLKLEDSYDRATPPTKMMTSIAEISSSRLRAVLLTTVTTVVGLVPTAYGFAGFDATLAEMMLAMVWGLIFGTIITLVLIPCLYSYLQSIRRMFLIKPSAELC